MSLRERISVVLFIMFCCYSGLEYAAQRWLTYPEFVRMEHQHAQNSSDEVLDAICHDFSEFRQQVVSAAQSGRLDSALKNGRFDNTTEKNGNADLLVLFDYKWAHGFSRLPAQISLENFQKTLLEGANSFLTKKQMGFSKKGIYNLNGQFIYLVAEPILSSPQSKQVEGMAFAGFYLTDKRFQAIRQKEHLNFNWSLFTPENQTQENKEIINRVTAENPYDFLSLGKNFMQCSMVVYDHRNNPALLLKTFQDKSISVQGLQAVHKFTLIKLIVAFVAVLFVIILLQKLIITPIMKLIKHVVNLEHPGSVKQKCILSRKDEIGTLATEFDQMCHRVQNAQIKLMEKSYLSGATEMSSGILHNVRNALSPITTRIGRIKGQFHNLPLDNLKQAQVELQNSSLSPERRTDLMRFIDLTFQNVMTNLKDMVTDLEDLSGQVVQIEDMLNTQKTFGNKEERPVEFIGPARLLENALDMVPEKFKSKTKINVNRTIKELPEVPVHSTTFIQILQNLVINACESMEREEPLCPKVEISCNIETHDTVDMLHWKIRDNGTGIEPDKIKAIFERGASSKTKGLTGIGLHWCANTMNAMKGRLWAESDGVHNGACFHILMPMAAEECLAELREG